MNIKYILLIFLLLFEKSVLSQNFMMNCISPDFKTMAFYKYDESKNILYVRPMKSRWTDFCKEIKLEEKNVICKFDGLELYRSSIENTDDIIYKINFMNYSLSILKSSKNNETQEIKKNETQFKCRKIKI